jgi:hypothetical protein
VESCLYFDGEGRDWGGGGVIFSIAMLTVEANAVIDSSGIKFLNGIIF